MIPVQSRTPTEAVRAPRVSGDDPGYLLYDEAAVGCSPRERG